MNNNIKITYIDIQYITVYDFVLFAYAYMFMYNKITKSSMGIIIKFRSLKFRSFSISGFKSEKIV